MRINRYRLRIDKKSSVNDLVKTVRYKCFKSLEPIAVTVSAGAGIGRAIILLLIFAAARPVLADLDKNDALSLLDLSMFANDFLRGADLTNAQ